MSMTQTIIIINQSLEYFKGVDSGSGEKKKAVCSIESGKSFWDSFTYHASIKCFLNSSLNLLYWSKLTHFVLRSVSLDLGTRSSQKKKKEVCLD